MESFSEFMGRVIEELRVEGRFGTAYIYEYALKACTEYVGGGEIFFGDIRRGWLKQFERYLENQQRRYNTVSTYLRALRAVYNRAVDRELVAGEYRLFRGLKMGVSSLKKLALEAPVMGELLAEEVRERLPDPLGRSQDLLALMFQLQGMPFADLAHLHKGDLVGDLLTCHRQKSGTELCVQGTPEAMALIRRYRSQDDRSPYLLNILNGTLVGEEAFNDYRFRLRELNAGLSALPGYCGEKLAGVRVSSYTARHTWATLAKQCEVPEELISEVLGHSSLQVTRTYLKSFEEGKKSRANQMIMDYVYAGIKSRWNSDSNGVTS